MNSTNVNITNAVINTDFVPLAITGPGYCLRFYPCIRCNVTIVVSTPEAAPPAYTDEAIDAIRD